MVNLWQNGKKRKAHYFISRQYWKSNYELVKEMMSQSEVYVFEADKMIQGFVGRNYWFRGRYQMI